jgi:hypothetical protein
LDSNHRFLRFYLIFKNYLFHPKSHTFYMFTGNRNFPISEVQVNKINTCSKTEFAISKKSQILHKKLTNSRKTIVHYLHICSTKWWHIYVEAIWHILWSLGMLSRYIVPREIWQSDPSKNGLFFF